MAPQTLILKPAKAAKSRGRRPSAAIEHYNC